MEQHVSIVNEVVETIKRNFESDQHGSMIVNNPCPGHMYMLPKIHKNVTPCPGRPIISNKGMATERLAKYPHQQLQPILSQRPSYLESTDDFIRRFETVSVSITESMIVFTIDVESLYTSINLEEGVTSVHNWLLKNGWEMDAATRISELLTVLLKANTFEFEKELFRQVVGTAMGSPVAPVFAGLHVAAIEEAFLTKCEYRPLVWWRYIDDIFVVWQHGNERLKDFLSSLNMSSELKFTNDQSYPVVFLDTELSKDADNNWQISLHRKFDGIRTILHARSCVHPKIKRAVIRNEVIRTKKICTTEKAFDANIQRLRVELLQRGYYIYISMLTDRTCWNSERRGSQRALLCSRITRR